MAANISIVIPTRERATYLGFALRSALLAADNADCVVEIVVSDNASADETAEVVAGFADPRIIYRRTERRLSMRENFQFALSHTTGGHIVYIGDDDAVLPHGLRVLSQLIARYDSDSIKWRPPIYTWPDPETGAPGELKLRPRWYNGRIEHLSPKAVLETFEQARFFNYKDGGMIYHGCISRRMIDRIETKTGGPFFRGSAPDVFTSMQTLMVADSPILNAKLPLTLAGASPHSNGASGQKLAKSGGNTEGTEYSKYIEESAQDPWQCRLPVHCTSLELITLDCLQSAAKVHGRDLAIDVDAWTRRISNEISRSVEPMRSDSVRYAKMILGPDFNVLPGPQRPVPKRSSTKPKLTAQGPYLRHKPSKLVFYGGEMTADAASAAALVDRLVDLSRVEGIPIGGLRALVNVLYQHRTARSLLA
jgi:hypothetical protein